MPRVRASRSKKVVTLPAPYNQDVSDDGAVNVDTSIPAIAAMVTAGDLVVLDAVSAPAASPQYGGNIELAYSEITAPVNAGPSSTVDTGLAVTFSTDGLRPVVLICDVPYVYHSVAAVSSWIILTKSDNTAIDAGVHSSAVANAIGPVHIEARLGILPAGTYTYKARLRNPSATAGSTANIFATDHAGTGNLNIPMIPTLSAVMR